MKPDRRHVRAHSASEPQADAASTPVIAVGQPGLSYRYVQTFGETGAGVFR